MQDQAIDIDDGGSGAMAAGPPEDQLRAMHYGFLGHLLSAPPSQSDLKAAASLAGDNSELGQSISTFAAVARRVSVSAAAEEYQDLFIGLGRGELVPYGSYYLTGFLHEKPLAKLRADMARLGLERDPEAKEPEDHIASVLEMMAGFIDGSYGTALTLGEQKQFYDTHIGCWAGHFFRDLEAAKSSVLYAGLGRIGRIFLQIEETAFEMV